MIFYGDGYAEHIKKRILLIFRTFRLPVLHFSQVFPGKHIVFYLLSLSLPDQKQRHGQKKKSNGTKPYAFIGEYGLLIHNYKAVNDRGQGCEYNQYNNILEKRARVHLVKLMSFRL